MSVVNKFINPENGKFSKVSYDYCSYSDFKDLEGYGEEVKLISFHKRHGSSQGFENASELLVFARRNGYHAYAIRGYEHSGMGFKLSSEKVTEKQPYPSGEGFSYPFSCPFDSGWYGFLLVHDNMPGREYARSTISGHVRDHKRRAVVFETAEAILETYSAWVNGEVFCYTAYDKDGEIFDSCGGYVGDLAYCIREARSSIGLENEI